MRIDWDVPIAMDDGLVLRADVFRPDRRRPLSGDPHLRPLRQGPRVPGRLSERVAAHGGQASRRDGGIEQPLSELGGGRPGEMGAARLRLRARRLARLRASRPASSIISRRARPRTFYDCIEWAGVQPWSNGKVGLNGISYYGINQWQVASLQPPHLAAMCIWEGAADWYRDMTHHGGILSTFWANWYDMQVKTVQYGAGERGKRSRVHGELVCGPQTLSDEQLAKNRCRFRRRDPRASARRRLSQGALAGVVEGDGAAALGGELGRPGACIRAATSKALCAPPRTTNGWRRTASSTGRISTPTTAASSSSRSSTTS